MKELVAQEMKKARDKVINAVVVNVMMERGRRAVHDLDKNSEEAVKLQKETLMNLLEKNANTEYGKKYGFADIKSISEYKSRVPFSEYDTYEPYIRRMVKKGEKNLITADEPKHYALSSGSVGVPKHIPVSQMELDKYAKYGSAMVFGVMNEYYLTTKYRPLKLGYGANTLELKFRETPTGVPKGAISGNLLKQVKNIVEYILTPPWDIISPEYDMDLKYLRARFVLERRDIIFLDGAFMTSLVDMMDYITANYKMLCKDIYYGRINKDIEMPQILREKLSQDLSPNPDRARELMREFKKGTDCIIPRIWPKVQMIASIGTGGFFAYTKKMRRYTGKNIPFNNVMYAASEGLFATARHAEDTSYVLIPEGGFYEFIPVKNEDDSKTLTIDELEIGEEYEIVITNLSGFYRYRIKDVIRVTGYYNQSPMVNFIYRKSQTMSIAGEKTNQEALDWSVYQFCKETGVNINDYSIYGDDDSKPGHYVFLMEPDRIVPKEDIPKLRDVIDGKLMQANPSYGDKVRNGVLKPAELILLQQETYQLYRDMMILKGVSANQLKPVRVIDTPMKYNFFFGLQEKYD